uniref:Uncharacterized protein n=1 Tax=Pseudo-nitzschia australis TaxID=44445 RepID=A0A6V0AG34_9STRA
MRTTSMRGLVLPTTLSVVVAMAGFDYYAHGFSTLSSVSHVAYVVQSNVDSTAATTKARTTTTALLGILDDIMDEETSAGDEENGNDERLDGLYHSLIFASDLQSEISKRLEECTDPSFLEYLIASSESTNDKGEQQGLQELIDQIAEVKTTTAAKAVAAEKEKAALAAKAEKELETETTPTDKNKSMSNADVLRKASEIDAAIAMSDEEKPSDFISDCREVVNLSRGFNDSGQMRVGGR